MNLSMNSKNVPPAILNTEKTFIHINSTIHRKRPREHKEEEEVDEMPPVPTQMLFDEDNEEEFIPPEQQIHNRGGGRGRSKVLDAHTVPFTEIAQEVSRKLAQARFTRYKM